MPRRGRLRINGPSMAATSIVPTPHDVLLSQALVKLYWVIRPETVDLFVSRDPSPAVLMVRFYRLSAQTTRFAGGITSAECPLLVARECTKKGLGRILRRLNRLLEHSFPEPSLTT